MKWNKFIVGVLIISVALLTLSGLTYTQEKEEKKEGEKIVAKVGDKIITLKELKERMYEYPFAAPTYEEQLKKALEMIVNETILYEGAKKQGYDKDEEILRRIEQEKRRLVIEKFVWKEVNEKVKEPTEDEIKAYYEKNKSQFVEPTRIKIRHIMVKTEDEAKEILKLLKKGEDFTKLAHEKSISEDRARGGEIGWVEEGMPIVYFGTEQMKIVAALKKGEVSDIIQTGFGYHIVKVEDIKEKRQKELNEVKEEVRMRVWEEKRSKSKDELINELKKKLKVEILLESKIKD